MNTRTFFKSKYFTAAALVVIALLVVSNITILSNQVKTNTATDNLGGLNGVVTITVRDANGTVVQVQNDTISTQAYDFIYCQLWVSAASCAVTNNVLVPITTTITATLTLPYPLYWASGLELSSSAQTNNACNGQLSTNGLAALVGTPTHSTGINTPIVSLFGSWTFSGTSQVINGICLIPSEIIQGGASVALTASFSLAYETISTITLTTGQSIGVTWTFSM